MNAAEKNYIPPVLGVLLLAISPHALRLPIWISTWCLSLWAYLWGATRNNWHRPGRLIILALTVGGFIGGLSTYGFTFSLDAGVGLLAIMMGLKPFEMNTHRDRMVTLFLIYFLVITNLLYANDFSMAIFMVASVLLTTAVLIHINHSSGGLWTKVRLSGMILFQALPLTVIIFLLFPRIQGTLFGISKQPVTGTGFADSLSPGSISTLVRNNAIAFRAEFKKVIPGPERLYWRGIVFRHFDGKTWRRGQTRAMGQVPAPDGSTIEYTVTLEPQDERWLFALDLPITSPPFASLRNDHTLLADRKLKERVRYTVTSQLSPETGNTIPWGRSALTLPAVGNPKSAALARTWADSFGTPEKIISKALDFFKDNHFVYSLNPPQLNQDLVDDFLFRTRKGYCEHYASAFAFLMRSAKIPARIVAGYVGGELNPYGNYLIVRQSDAHAWVEVWLPRQGWVRIDPTSAVAPERLEQGLEAVLGPEELKDFLSLKYAGPGQAYWKQVVLSWDAVNNYWNRWVLGYSYLRQREFFSKIGINIGSWTGPVKVILLALGLISVFAFLIFILFFRKPVEKKDAVQRIYLEFCARLAAVGLVRKPGQGPVDFARKAGYRRRDLKDSIHAITELYVRLRYAPGGDEHVLRDFKNKVEGFHPTDSAGFKR